MRHLSVPAALAEGAVANALSAFQEYTGCPHAFVTGDVLDIDDAAGSSSEGFFRCGAMVLFGRAQGAVPASSPSAVLPDAGATFDARAGKLRLGFNPTDAAVNLRTERYIDNRLPGGGEGVTVRSAVRQAYYALRPVLPVSVRKHAQRWALRDWRKQTFPSWPVDTTVDDLMRALFLRLLDVHAVDELPFIWFWPDGHAGCAMMTHDVETAAGRDFSSRLIEMEAGHGIRSAFEIVPEERYDVPETYLQEIRDAGCEVCVHGLNHDGRLFLNEQLFRQRAAKINEYARLYGAHGFRSPVMYRRVDWYDAFQFSFDMSLPNVAHLDPQRGGCCTVMPFFIGDIVELPLTTIQDYPLYNILNQWTMDLWKQQCGILLRYNGLLSFIIHPDYTISANAQKLYNELLAYLGGLRDNHGVWIALPGQVDEWWRQRRNMRLERDGASWRISGDGSDRARVAFARREGGDVTYRIADDRSWH
jgi:hypothetical protein